MHVRQGASESYSKPGSEDLIMLMPLKMAILLSLVASHLWQQALMLLQVKM